MGPRGELLVLGSVSVDFALRVTPCLSPYVYSEINAKRPKLTSEIISYTRWFIWIMPSTLEFEVTNTYYQKCVAAACLKNNSVDANDLVV